MADYTQSIDFSAKDALNTGDSNKIAKGADIDTELSLISTSLGQKLNKDTTGAGGITTQAEAEAGTLNTAVMTPLRAEQHVTNWAKENDGMVFDIHELDLSADALLGWDQGAAAAIGFTAGTAMAISGTTFEMSHLGIEDLADAGSDKILFWDDGAGKTDWLVANTGLAISGTNLNWSSSGISGHDGFTDFVAGEHILHSGVTVTAGAGMTGGGTIDATITLNCIAGAGITVNANDIIVDLAFTPTWTGAHVFSGVVDLSDTWLITATLDDSFTGTQDNYAPTGHADASVWRLTPSSTPIIAGIAGGVAGRRIQIINLGSVTVVLSDEAGTSTAANRIRTSGTGLGVTEQGSVELWYDGTSSRWRIVSNP